MFRLFQRGLPGRHNCQNRFTGIWTYRRYATQLTWGYAGAMAIGETLNIRPAQARDLRGIQKCARAAYEPYVAKMGRRPAPMVADFESQIADGLIHVLCDYNEVCGFIVFYPRDDHVHLENVAVLPELQGLGYGVQLIKFAEQVAANSGLLAVELYTNVKMTENLKLYPYLGYQELGRWNEDGFDRAFFRKELSVKSDL